jgi:hypothetical protein
MKAKIDSRERYLIEAVHEDMVKQRESNIRGAQTASSRGLS